MFDSTSVPLSIIAGLAILTNASATMQNGATMRYGSAVELWRRFHVSGEAGASVDAFYAAPGRAKVLLRRRIELLLTGLSLLYGTVGLLGLSTFLALGSVLAADLAHGVVPGLAVATMAIGGVALALLLGATTVFALEAACGHALLRLHIVKEFDGPARGSVRSLTDRAARPEPCVP